MPFSLRPPCRTNLSEQILIISSAVMQLDFCWMKHNSSFTSVQREVSGASVLSQVPVAKFAILASFVNKHYVLEGVDQ